MPPIAWIHKEECLHAEDRWTKHITPSQVMRAGWSGGKPSAGYCEVCRLLGRSRRIGRR